jgi:uncharacterized glyoxalase superfamily protein PhnB
MPKPDGPPKKLMPIITVDSVEAARDFYIDKLGFDHVMGVVGADGQLDFCTVVLDGARIMFARAVEGAAAPRGAGKQPVELYLEVADVQAYHNRVTGGGVSVSDPITLQWWGDRTFKVMDPCGYECWFYQSEGEPKPPQGAKIV